MSRNWLWGFFKDEVKFKEFTELVERGLQNKPDFFYNQVMPLIFPQVFNPTIYLQQDQSNMKEQFFFGSLLNHFLEHRYFDRPSMESLFRKKKVWKLSELTLGILVYNGSNFNPLRLLLEEAAKQNDREFHSIKELYGNMWDITKQMCQRMKDNPDFFVERMQYAATVSRMNEVRQIENYNIENR